VSTQQFLLPNSDGATWQSLDEAGVSLSHTAGGSAEDVLLSANADLWTFNAGFNQDIGITVDGTLVAWKESGGFAGTFSPNAAFVETVFHMVASTTHSVEVVWKTNKQAIGASIAIGAGPGAPFSPARLVAKVLPGSGFQSLASTQQYSLLDSNGAAWTAVDPTNLSFTISPNADGDYVISGNADMWTWNPGYNQDIGVAVSADGAVQTVVAWKESGGFAGPFSPNAASVQTVYHVLNAHTYNVQLVWKTNKSASGAKISIGAGPSAPFSPTRLTAWLLPTAATQWNTAVSALQYTLTNSDGSTWSQMDATKLVSTLHPGLDEDALVSGNADLWTSSAGFNQDVAVFVTDNGGAKQLVVWEESGGFGGTFSPNAAFVQGIFHMTTGHTYVFSLWWKANKSATGATIWAGAGPIAGQYSPTMMTVVPS
jgi:hypothetical protein